MPLTGYTVIYGGSFNPPHIGHQIACMWLAEALNAEEVIMVPTYKHAFGKELADFDQRLAMCEQLCEMWRWGEPAMTRDYDGVCSGQVWVSRVEESLPLPNITINTVKKFKETKEKLAVAIGSDLIHGLDEWTGWDKVMELAKVVVVGRTGAGHADHDYEFFQYPVELSSISSSQIRGQIRRGKNIIGLVPTGVKEYIEEHKLYQ